MLLDRKKNYVVVGITSGLGNALLNHKERFLGVSRHQSDLSIIKGKVVIFCSVNRDFESPTYSKDNFTFLEKVIKAQPEKLIFTSTIDLYAKEQNSYSYLKSAQEEIIRSSNVRHAILRLPMLIYPFSRENHIVKLQKNIDLTLSSLSTFNYLSLSTFISSVDIICEKLMEGTLDIVSQNSITLGRVAMLFNSKSKFGDYVYETPSTFSKIPDFLKEKKIDSLTELEKKEW